MKVQLKQVGASGASTGEVPVYDGALWTPGLAPGALRYLVGPAGSGAPYTSVQTAITAAVAAGATSAAPLGVFVLPGTYTEDVALSPGIALAGLGGRRLAKLVGSLTYAGLLDNGDASIQNLYIQGTTSGCITVTGDEQSTLRLFDLTVEQPVVFDINDIPRDAIRVNASSTMVYCDGCEIIATPGGGEITSYCLNILAGDAESKFCVLYNGGFAFPELPQAPGNSIVLVDTGASSSFLYCVIAGNAIVATGAYLHAIQSEFGSILNDGSVVFNGANTVRSMEGTGSVDISTIQWTGTPELSTGISYTHPCTVNVVNPVVLASGASEVATTSSKVISVTPAVGGTTVTLPPSGGTSPRFIGQTIIVADAAGTAAANNITVDGNGALILGAATLVMNANYQSATLCFDGTVWLVL